MAKTELIVHLGVEGGGATIHRTPRAAGGYQFHVEGSSLSLDENDNENWREWTLEPVETIQEALGCVEKDDLWIFFHPILVHPDYRVAVWQRVQELARAVPDERTSTWNNRVHDWRRVCLPGP